MHVSDLTQAHLLGLESLLNGGGNSIYNLGNSTDYSVKQVIHASREITGHPIPAITSGRRAGDPAILIADSSRIRKVLGWKPRYESLESIIRSAWEWQQQEVNPDRVRLHGPGPVRVYKTEPPGRRTPVSWRG